MCSSSIKPLSKMFWVRTEVVALLSILILILGYHGTCEDSNTALLRKNYVLEDFNKWSSEEDKLFAASGICTSENGSYVAKCSSRENVDNVHALRQSECFFDDACHFYHDCCINYVSKGDIHRRNWTCREIKGQGDFSYHIYVLQICPPEWKDLYTRSMCETESTDMDKKGGEYSYLQDIPIKSEKTNIFYRNIFCALCNGENDFIKWKSYFYCASDSVNNTDNRNDIDFSKSYYNPRIQNFRYVKIGEKYTDCRLVVEDFDHSYVLNKHGARLCKPTIDTCGPESNENARHKCTSYTSSVYEILNDASEVRIYKNFHCALCNKVNVERIRCVDPLLSPIKKGPKPIEVTSLTFLFDFNFEGGNNQVGVMGPCKFKDGKIWDPILKICINFTCGTMFERKGSICVPRETENSIGGLTSNCLKSILTQNMFHIIKNGSVFINITREFLSLNEYEVYKLNGTDIIAISICADKGSFLLHLSKVQYCLSEITISLSIICLILNLIVYSALKDLRNCPGKILISLSTCLICGHTFLLIGPHVKNIYWICYISAVLTHIGYLSSFLWMNAMAYDIYKTFSATKSRNSMKKFTFLKYSCYCWITSLLITSLSVFLDRFLPLENTFRPKYGYPICWFNQRKGLLIFFIIPIFSLLLINVIYFTIAAFRIKKISQQTKMANNFSDRVRFFLYIKLSVVFGLTWLLGVLAGTLRANFLWYPFILFNGLQGVFIFISFTAKRKIVKMLRVKFKICSKNIQTAATLGR